jgi:trk system potassium uptake protein TrkH
MRARVVLAIAGQLTRLFCLAFLVPAAMAVWDGQWTTATEFVLAGALGALAGSLACLRFVAPKELRRVEALGVVALTWAVVCAVSAIPFLFAGLSLPDALFESMSGLTTTGATVLTDFGVYDRPFFLWRAMTHWVGGLGVISLFVVILPRLGIAGRQLFFAESSSAPGEGISPQVRDGSTRIWVVYLLMTALCAGLLMLCGMGGFDSALHAMATLAAGGFSPHGSSIAGYQNPAVEWVLVVFMWLAGSSFTLQYRVYTLRDPLGFFRDEEFRVYTLVMVGVALGVSVVLSGGLPDLTALRMAFFQSASLISSTGFASVDYDQWPEPAKQLLVMAMVVGGCAGSAAGGPKVVRHLLVGRFILRELRQVLHPRAIIPITYNGRPVPDPVLRAVFALAVLFVGLTFVVGVTLVFLGSEPVAAFSGALACVGNIGPGFRALGPMMNFAGLSSPAKLLLVVAMWLGRLEILTVLALLHPDVWRSLRWSDPGR